MPLFSSLGMSSGRSLGLGTSSVKDPYFNDRLAFTLPSIVDTNANTTSFVDSSTANTGGTGFTVNRFGNTHMGSYSPFNTLGDPDSKRWSYMFDGGNLAFPTAVLTNFGGWGSSRKNTIEFWIKPKYGNVNTDNNGAGQLGQGVIIGAYEAVAANGRWSLGITKARNIIFAYTTSTSSETGISTTLSLDIDRWSHVCLTIDGATSTAVIYINGVGQTFTGLALGTQGTTYNAWFGICRTLFGGYYGSAVCALSNLRWVTNALVYTSNFTPPTEPLKRIDGTILLTLQDSIPVDNSANTNAMDPSVSVSLIPSSPFPTSKRVYNRLYEGGSTYFNGSSDYLTIPDDANLEIGSSQFCAELMFNPTSTATSVLFGKRGSSSLFGPFLIYYTSGNVYVYMSTTGASWNFVNGVLLGTAYEGGWNHTSIYRVGNDWYGSLNGVITTLKSATSDTLVDQTASYHIGADVNGANYFNGYITNVRLVIGSSVYTSASAPIPTAPLTNITNTKLLLLMNNFNYFDPTRQHTIQTLGTVSLVSSPSKWGNSVLSLSRTSGAVNSIIVPDKSHLNFARETSQPSDFTIEFWIYPTSLNVTDGIIVQKDGIQTTNYSQWKVALTSANTGNVVFTIGNPAAASSKQDVTSNVAVTINNWNHVACQRVSNNYVVYINGTLAANAAISVHATANSRPMYINGQQSGLSTSGVDAYLDGLRIVRGVSVYSGATATIPRGPFGNQ